jgi:AAA domain
VAQATIAGLPIQKVGERLEKIKALIYGEPGAGKTYLVGSAREVPEMQPILFIDIEGGIKTIRNLWSDIDTVRVRDEYNPQGKLVKSGWERLLELKEELRKPNSYETLIVDSISELYNLALTDWMRNPIRLSNRALDPDIPDERAWGKARSMVRRELTAYRDIDKHVLFTALKEAKYQGEILINYIPSLPGKLAYEISGFMDEVLYIEPMKVDKKEADYTKIPRRILCHPVNKYICKDRSRNLPLILENATMNRIADHVLDSRGGKK